MKLFSHRSGLKKTRTEVQLKSMDLSLRNRLWNVLDYFYWHDRLRSGAPIEGDYRVLFTRIWHSYFKEPVDELKFQWYVDLTSIRRYFFACDWCEVYDFIEFVSMNFPIERTNDSFKKAINGVLKEEMSAYRFIGNQITQITSEEEIEEIEETLATSIIPVRTHIENSLKLLSDRKNPDYRNSIKEAISAVESICRLITKNENATLGKALNEVETKIGLHGALKKGFSNLYGYTSSAEVIRHALLDETELSFEDAKFMLVSCSAFINYLIVKTEKAKISL